MNNLSITDDGTFVYLHTAETGQPKAVIYGADFLNKSDAQPQQIFQWKDQSESFAIKYVKLQE